MLFLDPFRVPEIAQFSGQISKKNSLSLRTDACKPKNKHSTKGTSSGGKKDFQNKIYTPVFLVLTKINFPK